MTTTDTAVQNLIINTMTRAQYSSITPSATELYMITDDIPLSQSDILGTVTSSSTNANPVGAKLFYDTCGDIETLINAL